MVTPETIADYVNRIDDRLARSESDLFGPSRQAQVTEAAREACRLLTMIDEDPEFISQYERTKAGGEAALRVGMLNGTIPRGTDRPWTFMRSNPSHFRNFLTLERRLLERAGVRPELATWLVNNVQDHLDELVTQDSANELERAIKSLRRRTCALVPELREAERRVRYRWAFGGIAVDVAFVGVDVSAVGATASLSMGFGCVMRALA